ncbi:MAG: shikimate kinase [Planctomycetales bacterium]
MNLILIGYRGSGKTSVGRELSRRLGWPCIDADDLIEARAGCSIREMFETRGEPYFRDLEEEVVAEILRGNSQIISPGGGAILRETTRARMRASGPVVWLQGSAEVLAGDWPETEAAGSGVRD